VLSFGGQFTGVEETGNRTDVEGFAGPGVQVLENAEEATNYNEDYTGRKSGGFFLQEQIGWKNRLFVTAGVRADSHSDFGADLDYRYNFIWYPKLSGTPSCRLPILSRTTISGRSGGKRPGSGPPMASPVSRHGRGSA
jgi:hypothetical protein